MGGRGRGMNDAGFGKPDDWVRRPRPPAQNVRRTYGCVRQLVVPATLRVGARIRVLHTAKSGGLQHFGETQEFRIRAKPKQVNLVSAPSGVLCRERGLRRSKANDRT
jgi:hypothetical protein